MSRHDELLFSTNVSSSGELDGEDILLHIDLRVRLDEIAEVEAEQLRLAPRRSPVAKELRALAYSIYRGRRLRTRVMDEMFFGEPAWDMLLALFCLPARGEILNVTGLSHAAEVPQATGIRWQKLLAEQGLIERGPDHGDSRHILVRLTSTGKELMQDILTRLYHLDPRLPQSCDDAPKDVENATPQLARTEPSKAHSTSNGIG